MKMSRYTKNYIHEFNLEIEDKKEMMMSFKRKLNTKTKYIVKCPNWLDKDYLTNKVNGSNILILWSYGKSDVSLINSKSRVTTYISKYMIKSLKEIDETTYVDRLNKKRYYNSNNLDVPTIEIGLVDEVTDYISSYSYTKHSYYDNTKIEKILYQMKEI